MEYYVGRDVSLKQTSICVADQAGLVVLENHVRGLLKNLGLVIGRIKFNVFAVRAEELIEGHPELVAAVRPS